MLVQTHLSMSSTSVMPRLPKSEREQILFELKVVSLILGITYTLMKLLEIWLV